MIYTPLNIVIRQQRPQDDDEIDALAEEVFGPGRFTRTAFRLREGVDEDKPMSFIAWDGQNIIGSVIQTKILIGGKTALLLGPLMVSVEVRKIGVGRELMNRTIRAAKDAGYRYIILVGDLPYYNKFGFEPVPHGRITLPGPADPARILGCELKRGAASEFSGVATRFFDVKYN